MRRDRRRYPTEQPLGSFADRRSRAASLPSLPAALPWRSSPTRPSSGRSFGLPSAAPSPSGSVHDSFVTVGRPSGFLGALIALGGGLVVLVAVGQAATQSPAGHPPGRVASRDCGYVDALRGACAGPVPVESGPRSRRRLRVPRRARDGVTQGVGHHRAPARGARDDRRAGRGRERRVRRWTDRRSARCEDRSGRTRSRGSRRERGRGRRRGRTRGGPSRHRRPPVRRARRAHRRQRGSGPRLQSIVRARRLAGRPGTMGVQS